MMKTYFRALSVLMALPLALTFSVLPIVSPLPDAQAAPSLSQPTKNPVTFPGTLPGTATASVNGKVANIANNAISVDFDFTSGVAIKKVENKLTNSQVPFNSKSAFSFTYQGKEISLESFSATSQPQVVSLTPKQNTGSFADAYPGKAIVQVFQGGQNIPDELKKLKLVYRAELLEDSNYVRQVLEIENPGNQPVDITNVTMVDAQVTGRVEGKDDGSPILLGQDKKETAWVGGESPLAKVSVSSGKALVKLPRVHDLLAGKPWEIATTIGVVPQDQMRRAFSYYIERERCRSRRTFLHFQSWFDLKPTGSARLMINHQEMLAAEKMFFDEMNKRDAAVDSYWVDDGWDYLRDPKHNDESKLNVWDFDPTEFSNGFSEDLKVMESQGAKLSVWMSPFGGYGTSAQRRAQLGNSKLQDQNKRPWEKSNKVMRLSDPIYFKYFRDKVFYMMDNGVQGFKFDGIAQGDLYITGAKNELIGDYEKLFELMQDMRGKNKDVWINATVGTWGSPYWFWYADSIYRDGNDAGQTGQGNSQEKYVNYRDQQVYQNMIVENPLVPINSVMNHGVIFSDRTDGQVPNQPHDFSNKSVRTAFSNDLKNFFSMGIGLQELYLRNTLFNAKNIGADNAKFAWDEIAKNAKWARQNVDLLTDTHWIGGSPGKGEVYGTAAWHNPGTSADDARAMISVRNPSNQPKYIAITAVSDLQIPGGQATRFKFTERDDKTNSWVIDNKPYYIQLKPFEVLLFEGRPTNEEPTQSEKPKVDPCYQQISQSDWEITVDSEQATGNEKDLGRYAIDNNPNTIWHTAWDPAIAQYPHSATVDMGRLNQVCRLTYLPRQSGGNNGDIKTYDLAVSKDGNNWQTVVTDGTFANDKEEKAIEIPKDKQEFRYFKLTAKSAQNGQAFAGAAELRAWGTAGKSEWLDQENWKCSASDYEATGENNGNSGWPKHACDNNLDTQWHSAYSGGVKPMPHWLQIDLGKIADVSALKYTPRQDAYPANGIVKEYRVEYSLDSNKWNPAAQGTLTDGKPATINFDATHRAKYIRFTAISAQNSQAFAGAAELDVKGSYVTATPEAPTFTDKDGSDNDTYTIPKIEGVRYLINGNEVAPGVHKVTNGTTTVQITATAAPGWELAPGDWSWEGKFTNTSTEPSQPKPATVTNSVYTSADTTLQSWQNEKVTSMAAKPYIGALRPGTNYGVFGEKFVSSDVSDGTDAKMGLLSFDLTKYEEAPQKAVLKLTYVGFRGSPRATDTTSISVMAVDTQKCTNQASSCPPSSATWATRPSFSSDNAKIATSGAFEFGNTTYTGDAIKIVTANTKEVTVDVTEIVASQIKAGHKSITFALQENKGNEIRFASYEGANGALQGAKQDMAPQLLMTVEQPPFTIEVTKNPKIRYQVGQSFDASGIEVTKIETAAGTKTVLSADKYVLDSSAFDGKNVGSYPIKVTLKENPKVATTFHVYVGKDSVDTPGDNRGSDVLWYGQPASQTADGNIADGTVKGDDDKWQRHTLPIGNGKVGGTVWGEIAKERITFNEETLWTGGPGTSASYKGGNNDSKGRNGATLRELNQKLEQGAQTVNPSNLTGGENAAEQGSYQNWGNIYIDYGLGTQPAENYERSLNLSEGKANVSFRSGQVDYKREFLVSNPDNVMVVRLTASQAKALNLKVTFPTNSGFTKKGETTTVTGDTLTVKGALGNNGLLYNAKIKAVVEGAEGSVSSDDGKALKISDAGAVTLYIAAGTNYQNTYPSYRNGEDAKALDTRLAANVQKAANKGYAQVKKDHIADHQSIYNRVKLDLGQDPTYGEGALATDKLLQAYKAGSANEKQKRALEVLVYNYGRYLTIGSSRENSQLPSNLQGIWSSTADDNAHGKTPWGADFHMNVNLQMNYWPTYSANMAELATPMISYAKSLVKPGRVTAKTYAGASSKPDAPIGQGAGYMAHTENTAYGWTAPGKDFSWGWSPAAMPWLLQNVYEAYEFSGDKQLLEDTIYPLLKEEAQFYVNYMLHKGSQKAADGSERLTTGVAYSPEHGPQGTDGNAYESTLVWQLLNDAIEAAQVLGKDQNLVKGTGECKADNWNKDDSGNFVSAQSNRSFECAISLLKPIEVGDSGQIKEWFFEGQLGKKADGTNIPSYQKNHRHMSHLLGLFPGDLITVDNAKYMEAAKYSMRQRGDDATGWGVGQRINSWARTGDGNHAYQLVEKQLKQAMYPNLFDAHPPFQIDGNFGNTSGINEMLLQSNSTYTKDGTKYHNYMNLLPALPDAWSGKGSVSGLVARGNFEVAMQWQSGKINVLQIKSNQGKDAVLRFTDAGKQKILDQTTNKLVDLTVLDNEHIQFKTQAGHVYVLSDAKTVTPLAPSLQSADQVKCGEKAQVVLPKLLEGVAEYQQVTNGNSVQVKAVLQPGYLLAPGAEQTWEFTIPAIVPCSQPTPGDNPPAPKPTDKPEQPLPIDKPDTGKQSQKPVPPKGSSQKGTQGSQDLSRSGASPTSLLLAVMFTLTGAAIYLQRRKTSKQ